MSNEANACGCMWIALHALALVFFFPALLVTVPLHMMYNQNERNAR